MQALDRIVLGRRVAAPLLREDVHDDRTLELGRRAQRRLEAAHVVAVERAGVAHAEIFEERARLEVLAQRRDGGLQAALHAIADERQIAQHAVDARPLLQVRGADAESRDGVAELGDRRRVRAAVVVEDDDRFAARVPEVVQTFERHAAGHRPVADHRDDASRTARRDPSRARWRDRGRSSRSSRRDCSRSSRALIRLGSDSPTALRPSEGFRTPRGGR